VTLLGDQPKKGPPYHSVSEVCDIADAEFPEHGVIYLERFVTELYEEHGLQMPGSDRRKPDSNPNSRQDIVISIKPGRRAGSPVSVAGSAD
jgi:hypothetical protein